MTPTLSQIPPGSRFTNGYRPKETLEAPTVERVTNAMSRQPLKLSDYRTDPDAARPGCMAAYRLPSRGL